MEQLIVFGGTTEGREYAAVHPGALVCVTSEYARSLLPAGTRCRVGILDENGIRTLLETERPEKVVDATHPFAVNVTANLRRVCGALGIPLERISRDLGGNEDWRSSVISVPDAETAAERLSSFGGRVLLTTGSHTLGVFARAVPAERLYVRVLPSVTALEQCAAAGILPSHIVAMQGPFSEVLNAALYDQLEIGAVVTKDSGKTGGVPEKVIPALARDLAVFVIEKKEEVR